MAKLYVSNICAGYGDKLVLKNVSVAVESGRLTCLCGPNGCGKSTLISVLAGAVEPGLKILGGVNKGADSADTDQIDALELAKRALRRHSLFLTCSSQNFLPGILP